ncbi:hypothetical protein MIND_00233300 [Mycena indigotica]|uniref:Uncharacterized protein n=1 Tax=Mycena indigotica TaxID=2126181 RepID=A0A8H6WH77_9AGAR|nr:uncharacterized protein MIND_00233300 [Mycena indigotica]KAF7312204.1 hypothetical protein MIND_00233300 [Mycena indigotica]
MQVILFLLLLLLPIKIGGGLWLRKLWIFDAFSYIGDDYPRNWPIKWPHDPRVSMPIHDTVRFQLETEDGEAEWAASIPGSGIVYLGEQCRPFSISMFHQIRCLDILRKSISSVWSRNATIDQLGQTRDYELTKHCLNYMRQMVLCRAHPYLDPVLGFPQPNAHPDKDVCLDWSVVYREAVASQKRCVS